MKKEWRLNKDQLTKEVIDFSKQIHFGNKSYYKIKRSEFFRQFICQHPLKYQRHDKTTLNYLVFCKKVIDSGICCAWKMNRKRTKNFKISRRKTKEL